jgi:hypothetical protein
LQENENLEKKPPFGEQLESIDYSALTSQKAWREQLDKVLALQTNGVKLDMFPKNGIPKFMNGIVQPAILFSTRKINFRNPYAKN